MDRNYGIDIAKGLGIILVLIGHLSMPYWLINTIYFFHMPFFIMISGFFHKPSTLNSIPKTASKILPSYYLYGLIFIGLMFFMGGRNEKSIIAFLLAKPVSIWNIPFFGVFWFIIVLFVIKCFAVKLKINRLVVFLGLLIFFLIEYFARIYPILNDLPFAFGQAALLFCFYAIGYYLKNINQQNNLIYFVGNSIIFISLAVYSIYCTPNGLVTKIVNFHHLAMFNSLAALILAVSGSASLYSLAQLLSRYKNIFHDSLAFLGENSFTFYALHLFVYFILKHIIKLIIKPENKYIIAFMILTTSIILITAFIYIVKKLTKTNVHLQRLLLLK